MRAIIGPNGAGKTTMMDIITGKTKPDEGDVLFRRIVDLTRLDETQIAELGIGRKFQKPTVFESQTIEDQSAAGAERRSSRPGPLFWRETPNESERIERVLGNHPGSRIPAIGSPARCLTARNNGSRSACCWRRTPKCFWSTNPWQA